LPFRQGRNADQRIAIEIDKGLRDYLIHRHPVSMRGRQGASSSSSYAPAQKRAAEL
jgi:hypothetical protein